MPPVENEESASSGTATPEDNGAASPAPGDDAPNAAGEDDSGAQARPAGGGARGGGNRRHNLFVFPADRPAAGSPVDPEATYAVVAWDLDTTGRRLLDEICQIGAFTKEGGPAKEEPPKTKVEKEEEESKKEEESSAEDKSTEESKEAEEAAAAAAEAAEEERRKRDRDTGGRSFSQYVMPHKNPNPGARRSFGIRVVNIGRYRMLKDMDTGKILKTKSEVSALSGFIAWLRQVREDAGKSKVILACHEPNRKVLVPLLLESLYKYNLMEEFKSVVAGFANGVHVVGTFGDKEKVMSNTIFVRFAKVLSIPNSNLQITSLSLRSLCKTVLSDTNPETNSASDRCRVLVDILAALGGKPEKKDGDDAPKNEFLNCAGISGCAVTVEAEEEDLGKLKGMLGTQATLRPLFESQLRQKRSVRERAMALRKKVAESGVDYSQLNAIYAEHLKAVTPAVAEDKEGGAKGEEEASSSEEKSSGGESPSKDGDAATTETEGEKEPAAESKEAESKDEEEVAKEDEAAAEERKSEAKAKLLEKVKGVSEDDVEELVRLMKLHFEAAGDGSANSHGSAGGAGGRDGHHHHHHEGGGRGRGRGRFYNSYHNHHEDGGGRPHRGGGGGYRGGDRGYYHNHHGHQQAHDGSGQYHERRGPRRGGGGGFRRGTPGRRGRGGGGRFRGGGRGAAGHAAREEAAAATAAAQ